MPAGRLDAGPGNSAIYLLHAIQRVRTMRTVSLMTANQEFSKRGQGIQITRHGRRPVARLVPHGAEEAAYPKRAAAHRRMMVRLEDGASLGGIRVERADSMTDRWASPSTPTFRSMRPTEMAVKRRQRRGRTG